MTLGELIVRLRECNRMSQKQLALAMGIKEPVLSKWENNRRVPRFDDMERLTLIVNCSLNDFATLNKGPRVIQVTVLPAELSKAVTLPEEEVVRPKPKPKAKSMAKAKAKAKVKTKMKAKAVARPKGKLRIQPPAR